jgi:hypothetical protein
MLSATDYRISSSTTQLRSTQLFTSAALPHNKFNYSNNPTYLSSSAIRVKNLNRDNPPVSYITTIGLYNSLTNSLP